MKKKIIASALIAGLLVTGTAMANWGRGGGGRGGCWGNPPAYTMMAPDLDQATKDKIKAFFKENQALRKEIVMKHAEKRALMQSPNPDPQAVAKVTGELFDLRMAMHDKAEAAGVDQYLPMGRGMGMGPGMGTGMGPGTGPGKMGNRFGGRGMGPCQQWQVEPPPPAAPQQQ
jgi:Spy/CpxP family protein refolding chaperone